MIDNVNQEAFEFLQKVEKRSFASAATSAREDDLSRFWTGVGFKLQGIEYVVRLNEVAEIIPIPQYTKVPGAKKWVKGIANIRGTLLPIMDLHGFLGRAVSHFTRSQKMLVVNHNGIHCGVIVDEILGLNHYESDAWVEGAPLNDEAMQPYLKGCFYSGDRLWSVFSLNTLADTPEFQQVALI